MDTGHNNSPRNRTDLIKKGVMPSWTSVHTLLAPQILLKPVFFLSCLLRSSNLIFLWNLQSFNYTKQLESPSSVRWFRDGWGGRRSSVLSFGHNTAHLEVPRTSAGRKCISRGITDGVLIKNHKKKRRYSFCPHNLHHFLQLLSHYRIQRGVKGQLSSLDMK